MTGSLTDEEQRSRRGAGPVRRFIQRQPDSAPPAPVSTPAPTPAQPGGPAPAQVTPEDRQRQLYAATILRDVPAPDAGVKASLNKALSFAPVYEDIHDRDNVREETKRTQINSTRPTIN